MSTTHLREEEYNARMLKYGMRAFLLLLAGVYIGYFVYSSEVKGTHPFRLGLDLSGGTHLVYRADVSSIDPSELDDAMDALRDIIERRVNLFGVAEPVVQIERAGVLGNVDANKEQRLIVELPGVTNVSDAIDQIGATPILEFKVERPADELAAIRAAQEELLASDATATPDSSAMQDPYVATGLTGRFLERAALEFDPTTNAPYVALTFNKEGAKRFAELTKENIGKTIAIYLDGSPISTPVVQSEIRGGKAIITGNFTVDEAKRLVGRLNSGALPVDKLELLSTQTVGASLGTEALHAGTVAGIWGLILVAVFLVLWYRLPGLIAVIALGMYVAIMLAIFKLLPVTLTAAGIAGFVLSIGMAVDANILIFERMKEELAAGHGLEEAVREGFARAWLSIRDGNLSSIITAIILYWFGTSLIEGFALTFGIGILVSMFSAITLTRTFLLAVITSGMVSDRMRSLFYSGFSRKA